MIKNSLHIKGWEWSCGKNDNVLASDIIPFFIEDRNKDFYIRGMKEYQTNNEKSYLIDTCLNGQDNYEKLVNYFLENNE